MVEAESAEQAKAKLEASLSEDEIREWYDWYKKMTEQINAENVVWNQKNEDWHRKYPDEPAYKPLSQYPIATYEEFLEDIDFEVEEELKFKNGICPMPEMNQ